jgi:hypothetical protein
MLKGEAHGDFEWRIMPADSNLLNSALAIFNFSRSRQREFARTGGVAAGLDVMLNPVGWSWLYIPGAQNGGEFLKQVFKISGDRIWNFLQGGDGLTETGFP